MRGELYIYSDNEEEIKVPENNLPVSSTTRTIQISRVIRSMAFSKGAQPSSLNALAETPSHFFKVILATTLEDKKLLIPEKFVRKFGNELSEVATLRIPNGRVWHIRLTKDGKRIWFHDGWHDFVKYHSICVGYFLVFKYEKNSNFQVIIFDISTCEIQYPYYYGGLENDEHNLVHQHEMKMDRSFDMMSFKFRNPSFGSLGNKTCKIEELDEINTSDAICDESKFKKAACKVGVCSSEDKNENHKFNGLDLVALLKDIGIFVGVKFRCLSAEERERAITAARLFKPKNASFMIILGPDALKQSRAVVPAMFASKCLGSNPKYIKLLDADGSEWSVLTLWYGKSCLMKSLAEFLKKKNLGIGDICLFEVIRMKELLKVSVAYAPTK